VISVRLSVFLVPEEETGGGGVSALMGVGSGCRRGWGLQCPRLRRAGGRGTRPRAVPKGVWHRGMGFCIRRLFLPASLFILFPSFAPQFRAGGS